MSVLYQEVLYLKTKIRLIEVNRDGPMGVMDFIVNVKNLFQIKEWSK